MEKNIIEYNYRQRGICFLTNASKKKFLDLIDKFLKIKKEEKKILK